jgi:hypothetical protein
MAILSFNLDLVLGHHVDAAWVRFTTSSTASWKIALKEEDSRIYRDRA